MNLLFSSALLASLFALELCPPAFAQADPLQLASPDQQLVLQFGIKALADEQGSKLFYAAAFHGKSILDDSALGLELADQPALGADVRIVDSKKSSGIDDYTLSNQKVGKVHDAYNSLVIRVDESSANRRSMSIEARAYNGGFAFRYLLPEQAAIKQLKLRKEDTEFRLSTDATDWLLALPNYRSSYESEYVQLPTSALSNQGGVSSHFLVGLPLLIHEPGVAWMDIVEADLEGSTSMYVTNPSGNWAGHWLSALLSPRLDNPDVAVEAALPWHSAWRVVEVADDPGRLVESTLQYDLSPPTRVADTSWIHPGKASWNWWVNDVDKNGTPSFTTDNMKYYVDFSAQSGFPYMMLDAGWSAGRDITQMNGKIDVPELARYAATKNVKVWVWCYSESVAQQMQQAFPLFEKWGIAGVKIDFVNRDDQQGIQWYYDVAKLAAEHHLMVDFHGTRTPLGAGAHLSERTQLRRCSRHGKQQGRPSRQPSRPRCLPFHSPTRRPYGLHRRRLQQRNRRWLRRAEHRPDGHGHPGTAARALCHLSDAISNGLRQSTSLRRAARISVHQGRARLMGRDACTERPAG